jgi:hypothetical protein
LFYSFENLERMRWSRGWIVEFVGGLPVKHDDGSTLLDLPRRGSMREGDERLRKKKKKKSRYG